MYSNLQKSKYSPYSPSQHTFTSYQKTPSKNHLYTLSSGKSDNRKTLEPFSSRQTQLALKTKGKNPGLVSLDGANNKKDTKRKKVQNKSKVKKPTTTESVEPSYQETIRNLNYSPRKKRRLLTYEYYNNRLTDHDYHTDSEDDKLSLTPKELPNTFDETLQELSKVVTKTKQIEMKRVPTEEKHEEVMAIPLIHSKYLHFPYELRNRLVDLKTNGEAQYSLMQKIQKYKDEGRLKKKKSKSYKFLKRNIRHVAKNTPQKIVESHSLKVLMKMQRTQSNYEQMMEEENNEKLENLQRKESKINFVRGFDSSKDRGNHLLSLNLIRLWFRIVFVGNFMGHLERALISDRVHRVEEIRDSSVTRQTKEQFNEHKRRIFAEIRRKQFDPMAFNPYVSRLRYLLNRKRVAASMIRSFCQQRAFERDCVAKVRIFIQKIRKCQRICRNFLLCKRAKEELVTRQFISYEEKKHKSMKLSMKRELQELMNSNEKNQDQIRYLKARLDNPFPKIPPSIRINVIRESLYKQRQEFIQKQIRLSQFFQTTFSQFIDVPSTKRVRILQFSVMQTPRQLNQLYENAFKIMSRKKSFRQLW